MPLRYVETNTLLNAKGAKSMAAVWQYSGHSVFFIKGFITAIAGDLKFLA